MKFTKKIKIKKPFNSIRKKVFKKNISLTRFNNKKYKGRLLKKQFVPKWKRKFLRRNTIHKKRLKKFRFWRSFKYFFLYKKRLLWVSKLKWFFNNKRILKHQYFYLYGKSLDRIGFLNNAVYSFKSSFFYLLAYTEFRLVIFLCRVKFSLNLRESRFLIKNKCIATNGNVQVKLDYRISVYELITKRRMLLGSYIRYYKHIWRWFRWRIVKRNRRHVNVNKYISFYQYLNYLNINYLEVNYNICTAIVLRYPLFREILINKSRKMVSKKLYRQLYFLY